MRIRRNELITSAGLDVAIEQRDVETLELARDALNRRRDVGDREIAAGIERAIRILRSS